jgi:hypothetical protein
MYYSKYRVRKRIEYRFRVSSTAVFTLYSYSKTLEYHLEYVTADSLNFNGNEGIPSIGIGSAPHPHVERAVQVEMDLNDDGSRWSEQCGADDAVSSSDVSTDRRARTPTLGTPYVYLNVSSRYYTGSTSIQYFICIVCLLSCFWASHLGNRRQICSIIRNNFCVAYVRGVLGVCV